MSDKGEEVPSELGRKRSRRSGWDVDEEPVKLTKSSSDSNISGPAVAPIASMPSLMVSSTPSVPLQQPQANANFAAMTAQMLAQQVLAKSGLPTGVSAQQQAPKMENRIYVGSLPYSLKEPDVVALFSAFGPIVRCDMSYDSQLGRSKGFCFVEFQDPVTAQAAMAMDGFELAGRRIKVGRPSQMPNGGGGGNAMGMGSFLPSNPLLAAAALSSSARLTQQTVAPAAAWSGSLPVSTVPSVAMAAAPAAVAAATATPFVLVRNIRSSLALSEIQDLFGLHGAIKSSKQLQSTSLDPSLYYDVLLEYSDGSAAATKAATTMNGYMLSRTQLAVEAIPLTRAVELMVQKVESASTLQAKTVVLEDMVTVEDTREPDLKEEIEDEAKKYGAIEHIDISVSPDGQKAVVKVTYTGPADAARACKALNGRGFAGRKIRASVQ